MNSNGLARTPTLVGWMPISIAWTIATLSPRATRALADDVVLPPPPDSRRVEPHNGHGYVPFEVEGARLVRRVEHLQPGRDWERMDVYVPASAEPGDELPCIVNVYGGGYGEKGVGTMKGVVAPLIARGYVVACPDYALQVHAPEAIASWDVANAIRHLRANAETYNVDPERIGLVGWSAGGWIGQFIGYGGPADIRPIELPDGRRGASPTIEPQPLHAEQPVILQAVVSDWGAGKLTVGRGDQAEPHESLSPDDPPLLTCYGGKPRRLPRTSVAFLRDLGVPAEPVFLDVKNTHVPKLDTPGRDEAGKPTTWESSIYDFFDRTVKTPPRSSAPQIVLVPAEIATGTTTVRLLSVHALHGRGTVHYTLDGTTPDATSPRYDRPVTLESGETIRAMAIKPGLPASRVAAFTAPALRRPVIRIERTSYTTRVGESLEVEFVARLPAEVKHLEPTWVVSGRIGERFRPLRGRPRTYPWMRIDPETGRLSGVPREAGVYPVIVTAFVTTDTRGPLNRERTSADARLIVITVKDRKPRPSFRQ